MIGEKRMEHGEGVSRVVIVTGASSGIGAATARYFGARGWRVVLAARSATALERIAGEIQAVGGTALAVPTDVTQPPDITALVERTMEAFKRIDVVVNNAGRGISGTLATIDLDVFAEACHLNVLAPIAMLQAVVPIMRRQGGGVIVNVSSLTEVLPVPYMAGYGATKAALGYLSDAAALELGRDHIAVVKVLPGLTATAFAQNMAETGESLSLEQLLARANLISAVPPERVAQAIWTAAHKRKSLRCTSKRDWFLSVMARRAPDLTYALLRAAMQRYVTAEGQPSDADIRRDLRDLGLIVGAAGAAIAGIVTGIWLKVRKLKRDRQHA